MVLEHLIYNKQKTFTYNQYRDFIQKLVENHSTSGNEKTEERINFTMLNERRIKK